MKFETFKAGRLQSRYQYKHLEPVHVNRALIKTLVEKHILVETTGQQRGRVYAFDSYLDLFIR